MSIEVSFLGGVWSPRPGPSFLAGRARRHDAAAHEPPEGSPVVPPRGANDRHRGPGEGVAVHTTLHGMI